MNQKENNFFNVFKQKIDSYDGESVVDDWSVLKGKIVKRKRMKVTYYCAAAAVVVLIGTTLGVTLFQKSPKIERVSIVNTELALNTQNKRNYYIPKYTPIPQKIEPIKRVISKAEGSNLNGENHKINEISSEINRKEDIDNINSDIKNEDLDIKEVADTNIIENNEYVEGVELSSPKTKANFDIAIVGNSSFIAGQTNAVNSIFQASQNNVVLGYNSSAITTNYYVPHTKNFVFNSNYDYTYHLPISFGVSFRVELAKSFFVESGVFATMLKTDVRTSANKLLGDIQLWYIGIPVKGLWPFYSSRYFDIYLSGGGTIEKCISYSTTQIPSDVKTSSIPILFSVNANIGMQFNLVKSVSLFVEPGVSYFFDENNPFPTIRRDRPLNFNLQAGLRFNFFL